MVAALAAALGLPPKAASETKGAFHLRVKQARAPSAGAVAPASTAAVVKPPAAAPAPVSAPAPTATTADPRFANAPASPISLPLPLNSINTMIDKGGGAVEILQQLHREAAADPLLALPCSWPALTGSCRLASTPTGCKRCTAGTAPNPKFVAAIKAAATAALAARLI